MKYSLLCIGQLALGVVRALSKEICLKRLILYHIVPDIGPEIIAYYNTSSSSIYVEWEPSIPRRNVRGILVGYRVAWDEDYFSSDHVNDSEGYADVALDTSNYTVTSLHEYWRYNIHVAGRTSVGHGTYSTVTVETGEDGKSFTTRPDWIASPIHPYTISFCNILLLQARSVELLTLVTILFLQSLLHHRLTYIST